MIFRISLLLTLISLPSAFASLAHDDIHPIFGTPGVEVPDDKKNPTGEPRVFLYDGIYYTVIDEAAKTCRTKSGEHGCHWEEYGNESELVYTFICANDVKGDLTIPEYVSDGNKEYKVMEIGDYSFARCRELNNVILPKGIEVIGDGAFLECSELESIDLPLGLKTIRSIAFYKCLSLREANLPDGLLEIGGSDLSDMVNISHGAFYQCVFLRSVKLPESLKYVDDGSFSGCRSLARIDIPESMSDEIFGSSVFSGCAIQDFVCPSGFKAIPWGFMNSCERLSSITLSSSLTSIGAYAFNGCSIASIKLPSSLQSLGNGAFGRCQSLSHIEIPGNLSDKIFGDNVFSGCNLETFEIPKQFEAIPNGFFSGWSNLKSIDLPKSITRIGDGAFHSCTSLTSIHLPESITSIGKRAFSNCINLSTINLNDNITEIGEEAFNKCTSLEDIYIPNGLTEISSYAFAFLPIKSIKIPDSVKYIRDSAFLFCEDLHQVEWSAGLEDIGRSAFYGCKSLEYLYLPDLLKSVGHDCFGYSSNLKLISLPASVRKLAPYAFGYSGKMLVVEYRTSEPQEVWNRDMFGYYSGEPFYDEAFEYGLLKVGMGGKERALQTLPWKLFANIEEVDFSGVEEIASKTDEGLTEVYRMDGVRVGDSAESLPSGLYIVRGGGKSTKVMVP